MENTNTQKDASSISYVTAVILCLFTAVFTILICYFGYKQLNKAHQASAMVAYLDYDTIVERAGKKVLRDGSIYKGISAQDDSAQFALNLKSAIASYADAGYIVINKKALIDGSKSFDITPAVVQKIGLTD